MTNSFIILICKITDFIVLSFRACYSACAWAFNNFNFSTYISILERFDLLRISSLILCNVCYDQPHKAQHQIKNLVHSSFWNKITFWSTSSPQITS